MTIKTIMFDLGGVIINFDYTRFFNDVITISPLFKPNSFLLLEFWRQADVYHQGKITDEEFYHQTCELLEVCALSQKEFFDSFNSVLAEKDDEIEELIRKLRSTGKYKLILLSNINMSHWKYLLERKCDFIRLFDEYILSHEVKLAKPDPRIFQLAIEKAGCHAEEILYIDDGLNNINTAKQLGIQSIKFHTPTDLERELKDLEII